MHLQPKSRTLPFVLIQARAVRALVIGAGLAVTIPVAAARAQEGVPRVPAPMSVPGHVITGVVIQYMRDNPGHPSAESLLEALVRAVPTQDGWSAPQPRDGVEGFRLSELPRLANQRFTDTGLTLLAPAVVQRLKDMGLVGVYVTPDPAQFRVEDGRVVDLRPEGVTTITLQVTTGVVTELRTVAIGERIKDEDTVNHRLHERIRERSPVQPGGKDGRTDLVRRDLIDDYVYRLNRRPNRRADVAVSAAGDEPGAITLDYLVTENRPWMLFAQLSNTGTESTSRLREHFGFIHHDLTNADDTLTIGYHTANFEDTHSVYGFYDRPFPGTDDRLRWRVDGSWYTYLASDVGFPGLDFEGDGYTLGGSLAWNIFQDGPLFLDLVGGAQFKHIEVSNEAAGTEADEDFFVPSLAVRLERNTEIARTNASLGVEFNASGLAGTGEDLDALGRTAADEDWVLLRGEASHSFYLEPLFDPNASNTGGLAHEVLLTSRGQYAFDNRLIPNEEQPVGGLYTVRGYPESATAGDTVVMATAEYRYHLPKNLSPSPTPGSLFGDPFRWRPQYQYGPTDWDLVLKGFVDAARVLNSDRLPFEADNTLVSAGIGAELSVTRRFNLRVDWGFALRDLKSASGDSEVDAGHNEVSFVLTLIY